MLRLQLKDRQEDHTNCMAVKFSIMGTCRRIFACIALFVFILGIALVVCDDWVISTLRGDGWVYYSLQEPLQDWLSLIFVSFTLCTLSLIAMCLLCRRRRPECKKNSCE